MALLIFDLDGTMVDCKELHHLSFRQAVESEIPDACFMDSAVEGLPTTEKIKKLRTMGIPLSDNVDVVKKNITSDLVEDYVSYNPELYAHIERLNKTHQLVLCSNSRSEFVFKCLNILQLWQFELVYTRDYGPPKPDPWMYEQCMNTLDIPASDTYIFEDSPVGIAGARASGANVIPIVDSSDLIRKLHEF